MKNERVLFHICCANCATYVYKKLKENFDEVSGFWYNPNIHPYLEYKKRLDALKYLVEKENIKIFYNENYDLENFLQKIVFNEEKRCEICYKLRLSETVKKAKEIGYEHFTTTLLISPYQNRDKIRESGERLGKEFNLKFYYEDFSIGYKESVKTSSELNLYRQKYCGCIYSEKERYYKRLKKV